MGESESDNKKGKMRVCVWWGGGLVGDVCGNQIKLPRTKIVVKEYTKNGHYVFEKKM